MGSTSNSPLEVSGQVLDYVLGGIDASVAAGTEEHYVVFAAVSHFDVERIITMYVTRGMR